MSPSRILHLSDLHANDAWFEWVKTMRDPYGLVVISGDLLNLNARTPLGEQVPRVTAHLSALASAPLALVSGNHDGLPERSHEIHGVEWMGRLRTEHVRIDGDVFAFAGFTLRCIGWGEAVLESAGENEVWIAHSPPDGATTAVSRDGTNFGDWDLGRVCAEGRGPRLLLGGHVHDPRSWCSKVGRTWSLNPGCPEGEVHPNYNVVDLGRGLATHHRADGTSDIRRL